MQLEKYTCNIQFVFTLGDGNCSTIIYDDDNGKQYNFMYKEQINFKKHVDENDIDVMIIMGMGMINTIIIIIIIILITTTMIIIMVV